LQELLVVPGAAKLVYCSVLYVTLVLGDGNSCVAGAAKLATAVGCSLVLEWKILACRGSLQTCATAVGCSSGTWAGSSCLSTAVGCSFGTVGVVAKIVVFFALELRFSSVLAIQFLMGTKAV